MTDSKQYHKRCRDCGRFVPRERWVPTGGKYKQNALCVECASNYEDPLHD